MRLSLIIICVMDHPGHELRRLAPPPHGDSAGGSDIPRIDVVKLLQGKTQALLLFNGNEYRLRVTRQGKLLLTK